MANLLTCEYTVWNGGEPTRTFSLQNKASQVKRANLFSVPYNLRGNPPTTPEEGI